MNIVVLSERFWPEGSGGELATYLFLKKIIKKKNWYFRVITGTNYDKIPEDIKNSKNVEIITLNALQTKHRVHLWIKLLRNIDILMKFLKNTDIVYLPGISVITSSAIKKKIRNIKIIHHLHGYLPLSYNSAVYYPFEHRRKRIFIDTCYYASKKGIKYLISCLILHHPLTRIVQKNLKEIDYIICVSKRQANIIRSSLPWIKERIRIIYNPVPEDVYYLDPRSLDLCDEPSLIYTGGDNPVKGFDIVVKIIKYFSNENTSNIRFILTNRYSKESIEKIKRITKANVEILGRINRNDLLKLYSKSWILLFPSIYEEPLPYTVIEASLLNTIPVSFPVGGVPEIVEGTIASRFISYDISINSYIEKIKAAIKLIDKDRDVVFSLGERIRPRFSEKKTVDKLIEVFEESLGY